MIIRGEKYKMEDKIFEMKLSIDKNSREFDLTLLEKIKKLSNIPVNNIEELSRMVQEVNQTQAEPEERLTDRAYIIEI